MAGRRKGYARSLALGPFLPRFAFQFLHLENSDVAEPDGIAVIHQHERQLVRVLAVHVRLVEEGGALNLGMVLHDHTILQHRYLSRLPKFAVLTEARAVKRMSKVCHSPGLRETFTIGGRWL